MATQLKNIIAFTAVGAGAQQTVAHGLNIDGRGVTPDKLEFDNGDFSFIAADATNVTVQNDGAGVANCNVMCEHWLTVERTFGPVSITSLTPQPFIVAGSGGGGSNVADWLGTTGADVNVGNAAPPVAGQVLKATNPTTATWQADSGVSNPLILQTGNGTVTAPNAYASGAIGHGIDGDVGTADVQVDPTAAGLAIGWTDSYTGGTARVKAGGFGGGGGGAFAHGFATLGGAFTALIEAGHSGSTAFGYADGSGANASIRSRGRGSQAFGWVSGGTDAAYIYADGSGSFAGGFAYGAYGALTRIRAQVSGSMAFGKVFGGSVRTSLNGALAVGCGNNQGDVHASGLGAVALGYGTYGGLVEASASGSGAAGHAYGATGTVQASGAGGWAFGYAYEGGVYALGSGSFAGGYAKGVGSAVLATLRGSAAFGGAYGGGTVESIDAGTLASGYAYSGGLIQADGRGSQAMGLAQNNGDILTNAYGAMARGFCDGNNSQITAADRGAFASGTALTDGDLLVFGYGSHGVGDVRDGAKIGTAAASHGCFAGGYASDGASLIYSREGGCFAFGRAQFEGDITARGVGGFALGAANGTATYGHAKIYTNATGGLAQGYVRDTQPLGVQFSQILCYGKGAFSAGYVNQRGTISASGGGAHAGGYASSAAIYAGGEVPASIEASALGAFAHGFSKRPVTAGVTSYMRASAAGAWAGGYAIGYLSTSAIEAQSKGSLAHGYALSGTIYASAQGAFASGFSSLNGSIDASGYGALAGGSALAAGINNANIQAQGVGAFAFGTAATGYPTVGYESRLRAYGNGSWAGGDAIATTYGIATSRIQALDHGALAHGYNVDSYIEAQSKGSQAFGFADSAGYIYSSAYGAFASGHAKDSAYIYASGKGARAHGYGKGGLATARIGASGGGAFAFGYVTALESAAGIFATSRGTFAGGSVQGTYNITASSSGAFAFGRADTGNIQATASNAVQFGVGVNSASNTMQIGSAGLRFWGAGYPVAPQDGDIWVNNNYVYIRSNGVSCKCVNAAM
jgi:hypothetical protein